MLIVPTTAGHRVGLTVGERHAQDMGEGSGQESLLLEVGPIRRMLFRDACLPWCKRA
jgi:hypothetical protein